MRKFIITIEGKQYEVGVEEVSTEGQPIVSTPNIASAPVIPVAPVVTPTAPVKVTSTTPVAGGTPMKAPMPGMIAGFKVESGATVKKGQVVVVLEAMKMENDLISPCDGVITFKTTKGANVDTGDVIAVIA